MTTIEETSDFQKHEWPDVVEASAEAQVEAAHPPRRFPELLPVKLSDAEIGDRAKKAAVARRKIAEYEAQKSAAASHWKAKIELAENERDELLDVIDSGVEDRAVECVESYEYRTGTVRVHRVDNGTLIRERAMTSQERQPDLFSTDAVPATEDEDGPVEIPDAGPDSESDVTDPQAVLDAEPSSEEKAAPKLVRRRKKSS